MDSVDIAETNTAASEQATVSKSPKSKPSHKRPQVMAPHPRDAVPKERDLEADEQYEVEDSESDDEEVLAQRQAIQAKAPLQQLYCTTDDKETHDLVKRGLLDDHGVAVDDGTLTLEDLVPLHSDPLYSVQWSRQKKRGNSQTSKDGAEPVIQNLEGLSDSELASLMQACPDLEIGSAPAERIGG